MEHQTIALRAKVRLYKANAIQIHMKLTACVCVKGSRKIKTPMSNINDGAMYCRKPTLESGILLAPCANQKSGMTVTMPAKIKRRSVTGDTLNNAPRSVHTPCMIIAIARGSNTRVSIIKPRMGSTFVFFFNNP